MMNEHSMRKERKTVGTLHPKGTMFLRETVGSAEGDDGKQYEVCCHFGQGFPIVQSKQTGKYWTIDWQKLINLAVEDGIDKPD